MRSATARVSEIKMAPTRCEWQSGVLTEPNSSKKINKEVERSVSSCKETKRETGLCTETNFSQNSLQ